MSQWLLNTEASMQNMDSKYLLKYNSHDITFIY